MTQRLPEWLITPGTTNYVLTTVGGKAQWIVKDTIPDSLDDFIDVDTSSTPPDPGDGLTWSGTQWVPGIPDVSAVDEKWKGVWQAAPEELIYSNDFSAGLGLVTGLGTPTLMASVVGTSKPVGFTHADYYVVITPTGLITVASLNFASIGALTGRTLSRVKVRYAYRHDQQANLSHSITWGLRINGTAFWSTVTTQTLSSQNFESAWAQAEATAGLTPTSVFSATWQVTSGSTNLPDARMAITDLQVWAVTVGWNGYVTNDLVLYNGQIWQSQIEDNLDVPGTTANWVYKPKNGMAVNVQTGTTYTFATTDADKIVTLANAGAITATLPLNSAQAFPIGAGFEVVQTGAGAVSIAPTAGVTLYGLPALRIGALGGALRFRKVDTDTWVVVPTIVGRSVNAQVGTTYTTVVGDAGGTVTMTNAAASALTIPPNSAVAYPVGTLIKATQLGAGQVTLTPGAGVSLRNRVGLKLAGQYASALLEKIGTDEWTVLGDTAA